MAKTNRSLKVSYSRLGEETTGPEELKSKKKTAVQGKEGGPNVLSRNIRKKEKKKKTQYNAKKKRGAKEHVALKNPWGSKMMGEGGGKNPNAQFAKENQGGQCLEGVKRRKNEREEADTRHIGEATVSQKKSRTGQK